MGHGLVARELGRQVVALEGDEGSLVAHAIAVVGGGEDGDTLPVVIYLVSLVFDLVTANDVV